MNKCTTIATQLQVLADRLCFEKICIDTDTNKRYSK